MTLVHGNAEATPFADASFDLAISEYGAAIWCDPYAWVPEAHRILRPGGRLVFMGNHPLIEVCTPWDGGDVSYRLERDYFSLHRLDFRDVAHEPGGVEFNLPFSGWLALFARTGFEVEELIEPRAPVDASGDSFGVPADWAKRFPSEQVWKLRKR